MAHHAFVQVDALQHIATEGNRARDEFQAKARRSHPAQPGAVAVLRSVGVPKLCSTTRTFAELEYQHHFGDLLADLFQCGCCRLDAEDRK